MHSFNGSSSQRCKRAEILGPNS